MINDLLAVEHVAKILAVRRRFVYRLVAQGRIPFVRIGRYIRFRPEAIDKWMRARSSGFGEEFHNVSKTECNSQTDPGS